MLFKKKPKKFAYLIGVILLFFSGIFAVLPIDMLLRTDNANWFFLYILDAVIVAITSFYWSMLVKDSYNDI